MSLVQHATSTTNTKEEEREEEEQEGGEEDVLHRRGTIEIAQEQNRAIRERDEVICSLEGERSRWKGEFANLKDIGWCLCYASVDFDWLWKDEKCQQI